MKRLIILLFPLFFLSCLGTKKTTETNTSIKEKEKVEINNDSTNVKEVNRSIDDEFLFSLRTNDSITNEAIRKALKDFQQEKRSGSNSSSIRFDYEKLGLVLKNSIGETQDISIETNKEKDTEKSVEEETKEYMKKVMQVIPWWLYVIAFVVFLPAIIKWVKMIVGVFYPVIGLLNKKR